MRNLMIVVFGLFTGAVLGDPALTKVVDFSASTAPALQVYQANARTITWTLRNNNAMVNGTNYTPFMYIASSNTSPYVVTATCAWVTQTAGVFNAVFAPADLNTNGSWMYGVGMLSPTQTTARQGSFIIIADPLAGGASAITLQGNVDYSLVNFQNVTNGPLIPGSNITYRPTGSRGQYYIDAADATAMPGALTAGSNVSELVNNVPYLTPASTQGLVTVSVTNGLASLTYVDNHTGLTSTAHGGVVLQSTTGALGVAYAANAGASVDATYWTASGSGNQYQAPASSASEGWVVARSSAPDAGDVRTMIMTNWIDNARKATYASVADTASNLVAGYKSESSTNADFATVSATASNLDAASVITDIQHGQKGGTNLHALADGSGAGFISVMGYNTLQVAVTNNQTNVTIEVTDATAEQNPVSLSQLNTALASFSQKTLYGVTNAHPVIAGAGSLWSTNIACCAWTNIQTHAAASTNLAGVFWNTNAYDTIRAGNYIGRFFAVSAGGGSKFAFIQLVYTPDNGTTTNIIDTASQVPIGTTLTSYRLTTDNKVDITAPTALTNLYIGVRYYTVRTGGGPSGTITTYGGEPYDAQLETPGLGPVSLGSRGATNVTMSSGFSGVYDGVSRVMALTNSGNLNLAGYSLTNGSASLSTLTSTVVSANVITSGTAVVNGNLGVGTASPAAKLHSYSASANQLLVNGWDEYLGAGAAAVENGQLQLGNNAAYHGVIHYNGSAAAHMYIDNTWDNDEARILLRTRTAGTTNNGICVQGTGNVGVGTISPAAKLHVAGEMLASNVTVTSTGIVSSTGSGGFVGNGAGITNVPEIVPPIQFFAEAGFVQGQAYSPYWEVAYSDTSAECTANFAIRKAGAYKFVMVWETVADNTSKTMSGKIFAISKTNGAVIASYNLFDTENWDLTIPNGARTVSVSTFPTAFTVLDQAFVAFDFLKDDNAGGATGNLRIHAMYLIRQ
jgi:hypothetical protein